MLKILFWLLLAINGVLFASGRGLLPGQSAQRAEPQRLARQLNPDQLVLTPLAAPPGDADTAAAATLSTAPATPAVPATSPTPPTPPTPAIPATPATPAVPASAATASSITATAATQSATPVAPGPAAMPTVSAALKPAGVNVAAPVAASAQAVASVPAAASAKTSAVPVTALAPSVAASLSAPTVAPVAVAVPVTPVAGTAAAEKLLACVDIGNFDPNEARAFRTRLAAAKMTAQPTQRGVQEVASYMVYIAANDGRDGAERKAAELRRLGIADFYIMPDTSPMRDAVSLGLFKTEAAAKAYVGQLIPKGVRSARIIERTASTNKVVFRLRDLDGADQARFAGLVAAFPNQSRRDCSG